ncbi:hypothetical protein SUGI_0390190 [Cryptomeria japonica]|uniref:protein CHLORORESPIRATORY REDUCTION 41, chloroplastic n=1 Tax=Cryptomeria japonica TaxID=3369 RepID=UPI002408E9D7|nr:protein CHLORORESPIRATORY REDUCTION 41, chloroplastic [Cryptomeria japonica]GLJ21258.1 hypothetical protein SUGI_0390190 [Cryptomeria japonica]
MGSLALLAQVPSLWQNRPKCSTGSHLSISKNRNLQLVVKCSSRSSPDPQINQDLNLQKKTEISDEKGEKIEVGWKRTVPIVFDRPKGAAILAVLTRFGDVMDQKFGSVSTLAKVGGIVAEKVQEEADVLRGGDDMLELKLNELIRVVKIMEIDLRFASAARKEETLAQRLDEARTHCKQAIFIANAL